MSWLKMDDKASRGRAPDIDRRAAGIQRLGQRTLLQQWVERMKELAARRERPVAWWREGNASRKQPQLAGP
jgi:hypothetical protein